MSDLKEATDFTDSTDWRLSRAGRFSAADVLVRPRRLLFLAAALLLVVAGCQESGTTAVSVTQVVTVDNEEPQVVTRIVRQEIREVVTTTPVPEGETVRPTVLDLRFSRQVRTLDPQRALDDGEVDLVQNLFVQLTRHDPATNTIVPELATSWRASRDGRTWIFDLRDDIFWVRPSLDAPDEVALFRPVIADDVVFAIERACDRRTQTPDVFILYVIEGCEAVHQQRVPTTADLEAIGVRALDDFTLEVALEKPAGYLPTLTSMAIFTPMPRDHFLIHGAEWESDENLITSGPFVLSPRSLRDARTILLRNPVWPLAFSGNVDRVNIFYLQSDADSFALWQDKQLDLSAIPAGQRAQFMASDELRVRLIPTQDVFYLAFAHDNSVLSEPEVRRALNAAIDRERLIQEIEDGEALPLNHLLPPGTVGAPAQEGAGVGYDPNFAREQMEASTYRSCRLMPALRLMTSDSDRALEQAELMRRMWMDELECEEGQFEIVQVQFGTLLVNTRPDAGSARPDLWDLGWSPYYPDAHNWLNTLLHCTEGENRIGRTCAPEDDAIRTAGTLGDGQERAEQYAGLITRLFGTGGTQPLAPLYVRAEPLAQQTWLAFEPSPFGGEQYDTYVIQALEKELERELE